MINIKDRLEYTSDQDLFYDFCLWEYTPAAPYNNKFRSVNLLFHSFELMNTDDRVFDLVHVIRRTLGFSNTVWGLKKKGGDIVWEFYFYDYRRRDRTRSMTKLLDIIRPFVRCNIKPNENYHYFMFSIDINDGLISGAEDLNEIHMYIGNPGSTVSSGICYSFTSNVTRLENFYFFFDAKKHMEDIIAKIVCSSYVDSTKLDIDRILRPELKNCRVIVVANKQENDSIYFSGIDVNQLIFFLREMIYPGELIRFLEENISRLDHLQFDVGFDYRMEGKELVILKSGYYGIF